MEYIYEELKMKHGDDFFRIAGNEKAASTMRFNCPRTIEESNRILKDYILTGNRAFSIKLNKDEKMSAVFAFKSEPGSDVADMSLIISPEHWGKGLGNHIISDMLEMAEKGKWYKVLQAYILETNIASRKIVEKNGFKEKERHRFPGMSEDLIVYHFCL